MLLVACSHLIYAPASTTDNFKADRVGTKKKPSSKRRSDPRWKSKHHIHGEISWQASYRQQSAARHNQSARWKMMFSSLSLLAKVADRIQTEAAEACSHPNYPNPH
mmetsp:Transcript_25276/g.44563  ORF Transcript_25276/g.44563 Transcript_25276/m.44563 type:complete len:106 (-) Transcript_25276:101-418(-)